MNLKTKAKLLFLLFFFNLIAWMVVFDLSSNNLEVIFFDVGQGDAIFLETPNNHQILVDGGPNAKVLEGLGRAMPFYDRTIDLIVLTHPDHDHMGGLMEVFERYEVKNIMWTGVIKEGSEFEELDKRIKEEGSNVIVARAGQKVFSGKKFVMETLYPIENLENQEFKDYNKTSIVNRVLFGQNVFLLTGDAPKSIENSLMAEMDLKADVLKLGHHGSKNSTSKDFVENVNPEIAIVSCGKDNKYNHPHPEAVEILKEYGINILRTDEIGDIKIIADGNKIINHYEKK